MYHCHHRFTAVKVTHCFCQPIKLTRFVRSPKHCCVCNRLDNTWCLDEAHVILSVYPMLEHQTQFDGNWLSERDVLSSSAYCCNRGFDKMHAQFLSSGSFGCREMQPMPRKDKDRLTLRLGSIGFWNSIQATVLWPSQPTAHFVYNVNRTSYQR